MLSRLISLLMLTCAAAPLAHANGLIASAGALQAALLYNFAVYTEWPAVRTGVSASEKVVFCVMGSPTVNDALSSRKTKSVNGKELEVRAVSSIAQTSSCHLLFVGPDEHKMIHEISQAARSSPMLLVAEENGFDPKDVTISLRQQDGRYTFKINQTAAQASSLKLSSKLLMLAVRVY